MQLARKQPETKQTEVGVIPADWEVRPVGSMGEVRAGKALAVRGPGELRPYLRTKNVFDGRIDIADVLEMPMTDTEFTLYRLRNGDVLLNEGQSIELVGRCAMYQDEFPQPCAIQNQLIRFRAYESTSAKFAAHLFRRCQGSGIFSKIAMQTTSVAHLGVSRFQKLRLAWPQTKVEQEAIAAALSDADGLIKSLEKLIAKKRQIKHGTMEELLTGHRRLPGFNGKWERKLLGETGSFLKGRGVTKSQTLSGDIPCVRYGELYTRHNDYIRDYYSWISNEVALTATRLVRGDILFAGSGETKEEIGKCAAFLDDREAYAGGDIVILRTRDADPLYLGYYLNTVPIARQKASRGQGDAVVHISTAALSAIEVNIPKPTEQTAIAAVLLDMDAEVASLEAKLTKARQVKQGMTQELLTGRIRLI